MPTFLVVCSKACDGYGICVAEGFWRCWKAGWFAVCVCGVSVLRKVVQGALLRGLCLRIFRGKSVLPKVLRVGARRFPPRLVFAVRKACEFSPGVHALDSDFQTHLSSRCGLATSG